MLGLDGNHTFGFSFLAAVFFHMFLDLRHMMLDGDWHVIVLRVVDLDMLDLST